MNLPAVGRSVKHAFLIGLIWLCLTIFFEFGFGHYVIGNSWEKLGDGGKYNQCGWLDDKFGVSWQIVPTILGELMSNPEKSQKVIEAFMQMTKFDIQKLINA